MNFLSLGLLTNSLLGFDCFALVCVLILYNITKGGEYFCVYFDVEMF